MKTSDCVVGFILEMFNVFGILRSKIYDTNLNNNRPLIIKKVNYLKSFNKIIASKAKQQIIQILFVACNAVQKKTIRQ